MKEIYNYEMAVKEDLLNWVSENGIQFGSGCAESADRAEKYNTLYGLLRTEPFESWVTGGDTGSYTESQERAAENLYGNFWPLANALRYYGLDTDYLLKGEEALDVLIRKYVLYEYVAGEVADELECEYYLAQEKLA